MTLADGRSFELADGHVVIAAITSCTNTSNPSVMIAAGLLARNAVARGLTVPPWVKTSLAPGSLVVTDYYERAQLMEPLHELGFDVVGYGCTTCIGNSGPLAPEISEAIDHGDLSVASVLSGNRNFEGRIHPDCRMNYLASPPLVVAYALAGTMDVDLVARSARPRPERRARVPARSLAVGSRGRGGRRRRCSTARCSRRATRRSSTATSNWRALARADRRPLRVGPGVDVHPPPDRSSRASPPARPTLHDIDGARVLALLGDSVTTDHISPAGAIRRDSPAGKWLLEHGVEPRDFNSYGSRRGNHEVMVRGTFANVRLRNRLAPGTEGGVTVHLPDGEPTTIYDAAMQYAERGRAARRARGQGVRLRFVARLGGQGLAAARHTRGARRELRAHPPFEPRRDGRAPARVPRRRVGRRRSGSPATRRTASSAWRRSPSRVRCRVEVTVHADDKQFAMRARIDTPFELDGVPRGRHPAVHAAPPGALAVGLRRLAGFRALLGRRP